MSEVRMEAMRGFLEDFPLGFEEGRYRPERLPAMSFEYGAFDLALCSHFLFAYSGSFLQTFASPPSRKMCRVADGARVIPLLDYAGDPSPVLGPVVNELRARTGGSHRFDT